MERTRHPEAGFSLVELAIVLVIMGIMIAGVLKGQDLIESARLKRVIGQIQEYRMATATFMDRYNALPGDFSKASIFIDPRLTDGEGAGVLSGEGLNPQSPAFHYWSHLAMAGLISPPGKLEELDTPQFGLGAPPTSMGGGITVEENPEVSLHGLWFVVGNPHEHSGKGALFTPQQTLRILSKVDTAEPLTGSVQARDGVDVGTHHCINSHQGLDLSHENVTCVLYFKL